MRSLGPTQVLILCLAVVDTSGFSRWFSRPLVGSVLSLFNATTDTTLTEFLEDTPLEELLATYSDDTLENIFAPLDAGSILAPQFKCKFRLPEPENLTSTDLLSSLKATAKFEGISLGDLLTLFSDTAGILSGVKLLDGLEDDRISSLLDDATFLDIFGEKELPFSPITWSDLLTNITDNISERLANFRLDGAQSLAPLFLDSELRSIFGDLGITDFSGLRPILPSIRGGRFPSRFPIRPSFFLGGRRRRPFFLG